MQAARSIVPLKTYRTQLDCSLLLAFSYHPSTPTECLEEIADMSYCRKLCSGCKCNTVHRIPVPEFS